MFHTTCLLWHRSFQVREKGLLSFSPQSMMQLTRKEWEEEGIRGALIPACCDAGLSDSCGWRNKGISLLSQS